MSEAFHRTKRKLFSSQVTTILIHRLLFQETRHKLTILNLVCHDTMDARGRLDDNPSNLSCTLMVSPMNVSNWWIWSKQHLHQVIFAPLLIRSFPSHCSIERYSFNCTVAEKRSIRKVDKWPRKKPTESESIDFEPLSLRPNSCASVERFPVQWKHSKLVEKNTDQAFHFDRTSFD